VREELEALGICVLGVLQLRSGRRDRDPEKDRPATPHFIVKMARGPDVTSVRTITQFCGLRITVESYTAPRAVQALSELRTHPAWLRLRTSVRRVWRGPLVRLVLDLQRTA
jgi:hypothetical protein